MEWLGILAAIAVLILLIGAYYYYTDPERIEETEAAQVEDESELQRARARLKRQEGIVEEKEWENKGEYADE